MARALETCDNWGDSGGDGGAAKVRDLNSEVLMSLHSEDVYVGHCVYCPDQCGVGM